MPKAPHNVQDLMLKLTRMTGSNLKAVECRDMIAMVVVGQMLPEECVVKGGTSLRLRFGSGHSRMTGDLDAARRIDEESFLLSLRRRLAVGWHEFTGVMLVAPKRKPVDVEPQYVMQPLEVKLHYRAKPLCTVRVEVSHDELGDADECEMQPLPEDLRRIFEELVLPCPRPLPLMPIPFQIAQKLHGLTEPNSRRVRDLVDLQLIMRVGKVDMVQTALVCRRLFAYRKRQSWPPAVVPHDGWPEQYDEAAAGVSGLLPFADAIAWGNELVRTISQTTRGRDNHVYGAPK